MCTSFRFQVAVETVSVLKREESKKAPSEGKLQLKEIEESDDSDEEDDDDDDDDDDDSDEDGMLQYLPRLSATCYVYPIPMLLLTALPYL